MKGSLPWKQPQGQGRLLLLSLCCSLVLLFHSSNAQDNPHIVEHPKDQYVAKNEPAQLHCKVQGDPKPKITWYRNGVKVTTKSPNAHRLLLNEGQQLFFLRIIHTKKEKPDVGTYYCNATNIHGSAISMNATLKIAVLRDDFRENPKAITVASGETATFRCKPPRGEPPPKVFWARNGKRIEEKDERRMATKDDGSLVITSVRPSDAGQYTCQASNQDGEKESKPATLTVLEKPTFRELPEDIVADEGSTIEMKCKAAGDPPPKIEWRKEKGRIEFGRARKLADGTLRIEQIAMADDGLYMCVAENSAGTGEAVGRLTVHTHPRFLVRPKDITVGLGRTATLQCVVTGNPAPTVFWVTDMDQKPLMFSNQENGRFSVSADGTLRITDVKYQDEHVYTCQGINTLGDNKASATLTVLGDDSRPPPVIVQGPANMTVGPKETALLTCQVDGDPPPSIRWYKDNKLLLSLGNRVVVLATGSLKITDTRMSDSGQYECVAVSETGETKWKAALLVTKLGPFHKTADPTSLPGPPSKLRVSDITDTSVHLTWVPSTVVGQSSVFAYIVEYFSRDVPGGWKKASDSISHEGYTVSNLRPDTQYVFLVRAKNSHGISPPSPISDAIMTREKRPRHGINMPKSEIRKELALLSIELKSGNGINATAIKVKWEVSTSLTAIEGYLVLYTLVKDLDSNEKGAQKTQTIADSYTFGSNVTGLKPYTWYEVCVAAYSLDMRSLCSNTLKIRTNESVPTAPPSDVVVHKEDDTFKLQWSPPPKDHWNGRILGYVIECLPEDSDNNGGKTSKGDNNHGNCSTVTDGKMTNDAEGKTHSFVINNILTDGTYSVRIAARTSQGRGVWSKTFVLGPETSDIMQEAWFIWLIAGSIGGALWLALCVFSFWMCRRRRRDKKQKMAQNGMYSAVPVHKSEESGRAGSVVIQRDDVMYSQKDGTVHNYGGLQSDLTSLLDCAGPKDGLDHGSQVYSSASTTLPQMKTFYQRPGPGPSLGLSVAPYATTTLINTAAVAGGGGTLEKRQGQTSTVDSGFRPINHAYVHSSASGSGDSCHKPDLRSSESHDTDLSRANTGHYSYAAGCPHEHCECMTSPGSDSSVITTDENGLPMRRGHDHKYCKISCQSCMASGKQQQNNSGQGQAVMNWAELIPPPPEHPPPPSEGGGGSGTSCSGGDHSGDSAVHLPPLHHLHHQQQHHHPHLCTNNNTKNNANSSNNNMAETRFIENRSPISPVSKISACSCPPSAQHERIFPDLRGNPPAYSDVAYPISPHPHPGMHTGNRNLVHQQQHHHDNSSCGGSGNNPNHSGSGGSGCGCSYQEGSGASSGGGSQCNFRPQSPATTGMNIGGGNTTNPRMHQMQHPMQYNTGSNTGSSNNSNSNNMTSAETMLHRCQSPLSCHNCGINVQPHQLLQQQQQQQHQQHPSSSSTSTASSQNVHPHHPHHPHSMSASGTSMSQRPYMAGGGGDSHLYSPAYPNAPTTLPGYRISILDNPTGSGSGSGNNRDSSDMDQQGVNQGHLYPNIREAGFDGRGLGNGTLDRACQSSLQGMSDDGMPLRVSLNSEVPDYATESDMEVQRATDCPTPDSSSNGEGSISGSTYPYWSSLTEDSSDLVSQDEYEIDDNNIDSNVEENTDDTDYQTHPDHHHHRVRNKDSDDNGDDIDDFDDSSNSISNNYHDDGTNTDDTNKNISNSGSNNRHQQQQQQQQNNGSGENTAPGSSTIEDPSFSTDTDFASAVARAAELSGLTVVGTTISDPKAANGNKKYRKHRTTPTVAPRPTSPYSTDSNISAVVHKPYPKSERKKQLLEQARKYGHQRKDQPGLQDMDDQQRDSDMPAYHRPYYPTLPLHHNYNHTLNNHHQQHNNFNNNRTNNNKYTMNNSISGHFYNDPGSNTNGSPSKLMNSELQQSYNNSRAHAQHNGTGTLRSTASGGYAMPALPMTSAPPPPAPFNRSVSSPNPAIEHDPSTASHYKQRPPSASIGVPNSAHAPIQPPPYSSHITPVTLSQSDIPIV